MSKYLQTITQKINIRNWISSFNARLGFCYIYESKKNSYHYPLCFLFPSAYIGFHSYKNKETIGTYCKNIISRNDRGKKVNTQNKRMEK